MNDPNAVELALKELEKLRALVLKGEVTFVQAYAEANGACYHFGGTTKVRSERSIKELASCFRELAKDLEHSL